MSAPTRRELNAAARDMCLLVTRPAPTLDVLAAMTTKDVTEIENWAALMHLDASDNDAPVPERPAALTAWQRSVSAPTKAMSFPDRVTSALDQRRRDLDVSESDMSRRMNAKPGYWKRRVDGQTMDLYRFALACAALEISPLDVMRMVEFGAKS